MDGLAMNDAHSIAYLRDEVARIIGQTIAIRRASLLSDQYDDQIPPLDTNPKTWNHENQIVQFLTAPPSEDEVDEFVIQCPFDDERDEEIREALLGTDGPGEIILIPTEFASFQESVASWAGVNCWLAGDDWPVIIAAGRFGSPNPACQ